jgi:negative regulator of flagellin synthesis FlgM
MEGNTMKIDLINSQKIINGYNKNKGNLISKVIEAKPTDTIEISSIGRSLTSYSLQNKKLNNSSKIEEIKYKIDSGTYNVDARLTAQSIIDTIRGIKS